MKVRFAADALADEGSWRAIDRIVDLFFEERHRWDVDDPGEIETSQWVTSEPAGSRTSQRNLEALQMLAVRGIYEPGERIHKRALTVSLVEAPPDTLTPAEAARALHLPAYVVVENAESDKAFLSAMIRAFGRTALEDALTKYWWEIVNAGGGGEIPKRVHELVDKVGKGPRRILVVADSDRLKPDEPGGAEPSTKTIKTLEVVRSVHDVPIAVLRKRESENYLPVGAVQRVPRNKQSVYRAFLELDQSQRDYFDMKHGFKVDERGEPVVPAEQTELFRHVPRRIQRDLCGGFGKDIWEYFEVEGDVITADAVRLTCSDDPSEIERILDGIEGLL